MGAEGKHPRYRRGERTPPIRTRCRCRRRELGAQQRSGGAAIAVPSATVAVTLMQDGQASTCLHTLSKTHSNAFAREQIQDLGRFFQTMARETARVPRLHPPTVHRVAGPSYAYTFTHPLASRSTRSASSRCRTSK